MKEKGLVLLLVAIVANALPTTIVNFSPVGDSPNVAPGFAYAFRATEPLSGPEAPVYLDETAPANEDPPKVVKTQYHSQDQLGQYAFGYVGESSTKHEVRTSDGAVRGSFSYVDAAGVMQTANYVADKNGYRVEASNLPQGPNEIATGPVAPVMEAPKQVQYTPEVLAARNAHFKAFEAAKAASSVAKAEAIAKAAAKEEEVTSTRTKRSYPAGGYLPPPLPPKETNKYTAKKSKSPAKYVVAPGPLVHLPHNHSPHDLILDGHIVKSKTPAPKLKTIFLKDTKPKAPVKHFVAPAPLVHLPPSHHPHSLILDGHIVHAKTPAPKLRKFFLKDTKSKATKTPKVTHTPTKQVSLNGHFVHAPANLVISPTHFVHEPAAYKPTETVRGVHLDGHIVHAPVPANTLLPPVYKEPPHFPYTPVQQTREVLLDGHIVHAPVPINTLIPPSYKDTSNVNYTPLQQTREVLIDGHIVHAPVPVNTLLPPVYKESLSVPHAPLQQTKEVLLDGHIVHAPIPVNTLLPPVNSVPNQYAHTLSQDTIKVPLDGHFVQAPVPTRSLLPPVHPDSLQIFPAPNHQTHQVLLDNHIVHAPVPLDTLTVPIASGFPIDSSFDYLDMPHRNNLISAPLTNQAVFVKAEPELLEAVKLAAPSLEIPLTAPLGNQLAQQVLSQFHSQDELGGFEFGYSGGPSSRHEVRDHDGITRGAYSYVDANGELQTVQYIADDINGFRVQATNLPEDPASITG